MDRDDRPEKELMEKIASSLENLAEQVSLPTLSDIAGEDLGRDKKVSRENTP